MLATFFFHMANYWLAWTGLFPTVPLWSPHGAVMTLIMTLAVGVLAAIYFKRLVART